MRRRVNRKTLRRLNLLLSALTLCAFATAGSALAATPHWASGHATPQGKAVTFTSKSLGLFKLTWKYGGGGTVEIECNGPAASGSIENPSSGSAGKLTSTALKYTGCKLAGISQCKIQNDEIDFESQAKIYSEAGKEFIEFEPVSGISLGNVHIEHTPFTEEVCALAGTYPLTGTFSVYTSSEKGGGRFVLSSNALNTHLKMGEYALAGNGEFELRNGTGETLKLGAETFPHWYVGSTAWNDLATGEAKSFTSGESLSFTLNGKLMGAVVEMVCSGSGDRLEGLAENPGGGEAAKTSATLALENCVLSGAEGTKCSIAATVEPLTGTPIGPATMSLAAKGSKLMALAVTQRVGGPKCSIISTYYEVSGKLIVTSRGEGGFGISGSTAESELRIEGVRATAVGSMGLVTSLGESLRLQEP